MKIAIIGSGISGLVCTYLLSKKYDVTLYEANHYLGGHTNTVDVETDEGIFAIDTGFIVYNDATYPNFIKFLKQLNISGNPTEMSFSVSEKKTDFEYNGHTLSSLFAKKSHYFSPPFYQFLLQIVRFNKRCKEQNNQQNQDITLGNFIQQHGFSQRFQDYYILPMCSAIWSMPINDVMQFPLEFFLKFFLNHGLLELNDRPQWRTIANGSRSYVKAIIEQTNAKIRLDTPIIKIERFDERVVVHSIKDKQFFDQVIIACHSNQALALLHDPSSEEKEILSAIPYTANEVVLHTDISLLPKRKQAWASWNYVVDDMQQQRDQPTSLTYNMNILQGLNTQQTFCVTLNNTNQIDPDSVLRVFQYQHPVYDMPSFTARRRKQEISGHNRTYYCGAYWQNGFHEDGVNSALDVCQQFGLSL